MKRLIINSLILLFLTACSDGLNPVLDGTYPVPEKIQAFVSLTRSEAEFARSSAPFALRLVDKVSTAEDGSFVVSPLGLQFALGMLVNGTAGETERQILDVLGYPGGNNGDINGFASKMMSQLRLLDKDLRFAANNLMLTCCDYPMNPSYAAVITDCYEAMVETVDPTAVDILSKVNEWGRTHSYGLIPRVLEKVENDWMLFLCNALYFKASWHTPFEKEQTKDEIFHKADGSGRKTAMMHRELEAGGCRYAKGPGYAVLALPYGSQSNLEMDIILPDEKDALPEVLGKLLQEGGLPGLGGGYIVDCKIPRFHIHKRMDLIPVLREMGMKDAFVLRVADLSPMFINQQEAAVTQTVQETVIDVDESGAEAASVTVVEVGKSWFSGDTTLKPEVSKVQFVADHPFLFQVRESASGAVILAGIYGGE